MSDYPEHDKLHKVSESSNEIGQFLDWMQAERDVSFCTWNEGYEDDFGDWFPSGFYPARKPIEQWLADYFDIDLAKIEEEKELMLQRLREQQ